MKKGKPIQELAQEVYRQQESKRDYISPLVKLSLKSNGQSTMMLEGLPEQFTVQPIAHQQIAEHLRIPKPYYDRMQKEHPDLLDQNVNTLFQRTDARRMVRTLDGGNRAFLSDRFRTLDNFDLLESVMPVISDLRLEYESTELTPQRMYLKVFSQTLMADIKVGDTVRAGLVISNSEVGLGALSISPMTERLVCMNGAISTDYAQRKYHVSRLDSNGEGEAREYFRSETRQADDRAYWMKVIDTLRAVFSEEIFFQIVNRMRETTERKLDGKLTKIIEVTQNHFNLSEAQGDSILMHLIQGGDLTQWGLANAITRTAQDVDDYDQSTSLEAIGGKVIDLSPKDWKVISTAK